MRVIPRRGLVAAGALMTATFLTLTACSGSGSSAHPAGSASPQGAQSLTIWADADRVQALKGVAADFTKKTGVKIDLVQKNMGDIEQDLITQVPTGKGPDIAVGANDWTGLLVADGVVQPVELGNAASDYETVALNAFNYQGKVYAVPYSIENVALLRNTKLASQAPTTWNDMVAASTAAHSKYPCLIQVGTQGDPYTLYPIQTSFGTSVFAVNPDGSYNASKLTIGDAGGVKFAEWLQQEGKAGALSTSMTPDIALSKFEQGQSPFMITGPWNIAAVQKAGIDVAVDPVPSAGGAASSPFVGVNGFFLSSKTKNKLAATDFLTDYIGTSAVQEALYKVGDRPPALKAAFDSVGSDPIMKGFEKASLQGVPMPNVPAMAAVWQYWGGAETTIINQQASPDTAWKKMTSNIQAAINKSDQK